MSRGTAIKRILKEKDDMRLSLWKVVEFRY